MAVGLRFAVAVLAPLALLAACAESDTANDIVPAVTSEPSVVVTRTPSARPTASAGGVDHLLKGIWYRSDGTTVALPRSDYYAAVMWNDRLVATRSDGEVFAVADVIAADGSVVESLRTTSAVVVNDAGTTLAWVGTDGAVMAAWQDGRLKLGSVNLAAAGESVAWFPAAVIGGPDCNEAKDGCVVFLNSGEGKPRLFDTRGIKDGKLPDVVSFKDVSSKDVVTYVDKVLDDGSCGGLIDLEAPDPDPALRVEWTTCKYTVTRISPDGAHVIGMPAYFDGLGAGWVAVLDARNGSETARYTAKDGFVADWSWSADGRVVFDRHEVDVWHLMAMTPDGKVVEIGKPDQGEDVDSPFTLIQH